MKNNYNAKHLEFSLPKKETIEFLLNYSKRLSKLELNGLMNKKSLKLKEN
ncbi:hypothetical protein [Myroides phaeus]|uniref:Uncharacterized protein n=1 Tax=Myroides phaeus TaxID=702745 RepID=A0A1G8CZJ2_9FLAO|nr:hypothetical protein [Myroides phaeus]MEC4116204.1 hypothetical protein [Myroides phaeus]SDH50871.1 hypothetical protein SAMN05421818_10590 [Myroides phaeus]